MEGWFEWRQRIAWGLFGLLVFGIVAYVLQAFLGTLLFSLFVYYAARPVHRRLRGRFTHPDSAVTATLLLFVVPLLLILGYAGLLVVRELGAFLQAQNLDVFGVAIGQYVDIQGVNTVNDLLTVIQRNPQRVIGSELRQTLQESLGPFLAYLGLVFGVLLRVFLMFAFVFYLLRDDFKIAHWFRRSFDYGGSAVEYFEAVDDDLQTIFFGNMVTIGATALIAVVVFYALNFVAPPVSAIQFPLLLGLLIGVSTLVPAVGMKIVYLPYVAYLFYDAFTNPAAPLWFPIVFAAVTFTVVDTVPDFVVRAYVSSGTIHMGLILFAYILGSTVFGWYGIFLGPLVLVAFLHFARRVFPALVSGQLFES